MKRLGSSLGIALLLAGCGTFAPGGNRAAVRVAGPVIAQHTVGTMLVNGAPGSTLAPGQPAVLGFRFANEHTGPYPGYEDLHGKPMHLVAVRDDLSSFAHVHPALDAATGTFSIGVGRPSNDPDNQDAAGAMMAPGAYQLFAEMKPVGKNELVARLGATTSGPATTTPIVPDPAGANGTVRKFFKADGAPGAEGDNYQVTLSVKKSDGMVTLAFNLGADEDRTTRHYEPVTDLEPWLGMPGHAILVGRDGLPADRVFRHLHAGDMGPMAMPAPAVRGGPVRAGESGPDVSFMLMGTDLVPSGVYKVWGQFKRQGKVLTFPFVIQL